MTKLKPDARAPRWNGASTLERINSCRAMLFLHGFLTEGESNKVNRRVETWLKAHSGPDNTEVKP